MTETREFFYNSPFGCLKIIMSGSAVAGLSFCRKTNTDLLPYIGQEAVITELDKYFSGKSQNFSVPIKLVGTSFEISVWNLLLKIPYGKTMTYSDVGHLLGDRNYARAVGNACNKNPIAIIVPCHRVVPKSHKTPGNYAYGSEIKKSLIELEKNYL